MPKRLKPLQGLKPIAEDTIHLLPNRAKAAETLTGIETSRVHLKISRQRKGAKAAETLTGIETTLIPA